MSSAGASSRGALWAVFLQEAHGDESVAQAEQRRSLESGRGGDGGEGCRLGGNARELEESGRLCLPLPSQMLPYMGTAGTAAPP